MEIRDSDNYGTFARTKATTITGNNKQVKKRKKMRRKIKETFNYV